MGGHTLNRPGAEPGQGKSPNEQRISDIEDAMAAASLIMNDDIDGAEERLKSRIPSSSFHQLGLGVSTFMRSVLGFEKDVMAEASSRLARCEATAWAELKKAQKESQGTWTGWISSPSPPASSTGLTSNQIYPPGSEFALVHAEAQIMQAVVAVLHESLTEALKGFYKLRKAFIALNAIIESEDSFLKLQKAPLGNGDIIAKSSLSEDVMPGTFDDAEFSDLDATGGKSATPSIGLQRDVSAGGMMVSSTATPGSDTITSGINGVPVRCKDTSSNGSVSSTGFHLENENEGSSSGLSNRAPPVASKNSDDTSETVFFNNPVDVFVHSGASMCFGILMLLISMVPPAFSRLLYIIGFKGDRERGVQMLWKSTKFANINGGMAGLVLLAYYNGLIGNSDILPTDDDIEKLAAPGEVVGYPKQRCQELLAQMRAMYPDSMLWRLEEARSLAVTQDVRGAISILTDGNVGRMRQVTALSKFELSINAMCAMDWTLMRDTFLQCVDLNDWSHGLYYYCAGCAELEMYRDAFHRVRSLTDRVKHTPKSTMADAAKHKRAAENYFRKAPTLTGKKKFMARQMPFDVYVTRKVSKWEERAKLLDLELADAIAVSPAQEMLYLWNGSKRMSPDLLEKALERLRWERCTAHANAIETFKSSPDESAIGSLCRVSLLRSLQRYDEAQHELDKGVLIHDRTSFKGPTKDDYILAAGHYEAAVLCWNQACNPEPHNQGPHSSTADRAAFKNEKLDECKAYLNKVAKWESFVLDARFGMKVQIGLDTIGWLEKKSR